MLRRKKLPAGRAEGLRGSARKVRLARGANDEAVKRQGRGLPQIALPDFERLPGSP